MKSLLPLMVFAFLSFYDISAQNIRHPTYKNEIGIDLTSFVQQFLNINNSFLDQPFNPTYHFLFRRHYTNFSLRTGIGMDLYSQKTDAFRFVEKEKIYRSSRTFFFKVGVAKYLYPNKKWTIYYGTDILNEYFSSYDEEAGYSGSWRIGVTSSAQYYGIAPFFGIQFNLGDRVSIQTEAGLVSYFYVSNSSRFAKLIFEPATSNPPGSNPKKITGFDTRFVASDFLSIIFKF